MCGGIQGEVRFLQILHCATRPCSASIGQLGQTFLGEMLPGGGKEKLNLGASEGRLARGKK